MPRPKQQEKPDAMLHDDISGTEEILCPVCQIPLAKHPSLRTSGIEGNGKQAALMRKEIRQMCSGKLKDGETVVAANCGHLFHRFCLRHYCYTFHQCGAGTSTETEKAQCPVCLESIGMVKVQHIDYKTHEKPAKTFEKGFRHTEIFNEELRDQKKSALLHLPQLRQKVEEAAMKLETYEGHGQNLESKIKSTKQSLIEKSQLYQSIHKCNCGIDAMHKENISIIRMYLTVMKDQSAEFLRDKPIPQPLVPYLAIILADEKLMQKFGEILKPIEINGLRSDTAVLMREILADVEPKRRERDENTKLQNEKLHNHFKLRKQENPVVMKVQNSKLSIFSRTVLDEESLQQILKEVKAPIKALKKEHEKTKEEKSRPIRRSQSDIKIKVLLEPRKRQYESGSAPTNCTETYPLRQLVPARKCKSTEPILMKTLKAKATNKRIVVKIEDLKSTNINISGDGKMEILEVGETKPDLKLFENQENMGNNYNNDANANGIPLIDEIPELESNQMITHSTQTVSIQEIVKIKISTTTPNIGRTLSTLSEFSETQMGPYNHEVTLHPKNNTTTTSSVTSTTRTPVLAQDVVKIVKKCSTSEFNPKVRGSVLEILLEDSIEQENASLSLVNDVSKITFKNLDTTNYIDEIKIPLIQYNVKEDEITTEMFGTIAASASNPSPVDIPQNECEITHISAPEEYDDGDIENGVKASELKSRSQKGYNQKTYKNSTGGCGFLQGILSGPYANTPNSSITTTPREMFGIQRLPIYQSKWLTQLPSARTEVIDNTSVNAKPENFLPPPPIYPVPLNHHDRGSHIPHLGSNIRNLPCGDQITEETNYSGDAIQASSRDAIINIPSSGSGERRGQNPSRFSHVQRTPTFGNHRRYPVAGTPLASRELHFDPIPILPHFPHKMTEVPANNKAPVLTKRHHRDSRHFHQQNSVTTPSSNVTKKQSHRTTQWPIYNNSNQYLAYPKQSQCSFMDRDRHINCHHMPNPNFIYNPCVAYVENALSELCEILSPPVTPKCSQMRNNIQVSRCGLKSNNYKHQEQITQANYVLRGKQSPRFSQVPDGHFSQRIVRKAKRRHHFCV